MKCWLNIMKQVSPATSKPYRLIETYPTSEGMRSRICSGTFETEEAANERRVQLEAAAAASEGGAA